MQDSPDVPDDSAASPDPNHPMGADALVGMDPAGPDSHQDADPGLATTLPAFSDLAYRDDFWPHRRYEDRCDRIALRAFLPPTGDRLLDVGAGFGRLADEYAGYRDVVLLDASDPLLRAARARLGGDSRFRFVAGDAFRLPFPDATFDALVCVRVLHHFEDPRPAIREFGRVVRPGGTLVLESANKRNLKAVLAYWLRRQQWSPFDGGSRRYVGVHVLSIGSLPMCRRRRSDRWTPGEARSAWDARVSYVHSPRDLEKWLRVAGFETMKVRSVGLFRLPVVTRRLPVGLLVALERVQQVALAPITAGPSVFFVAGRVAVSSGAAPDDTRPREE